MPLFALTYRYADDPALVDQHRPEHRAYLRGFAESKELRMAGPLGAPGGVGGLLVFDTDSADRVNQIVRDDPFVVHRVVIDHTIQSWTLAIGAGLLTTEEAPTQDYEKEAS